MLSLSKIALKLTLVFRLFVTGRLNVWHRVLSGIIIILLALHLLMLPMIENRLLGKVARKTKWLKEFFSVYFWAHLRAYLFLVCSHSVEVTCWVFISIIVVRLRHSTVLHLFRYFQNSNNLIKNVFIFLTIGNQRKAFVSKFFYFSDNRKLEKLEKLEIELLGTRWKLGWFIIFLI